MQSKQLYSFAFLAACFLSLVTGVSATGCDSQYGGYNGCVPSNVSINKKVQQADKSGIFVENVTEGMTPFSIGSDVLYQIYITNNSDQDVSHVDVKDVFPTQMSFVSGPGSYDKNTNTLTFTVDNLKKGETRTEQVLAKVGDQTKFAKDKSLHCEVVNTVAANVPDKKSESDTSSICVQTKVLGTSTLPVAGYNELALIAGFFALGMTGVALTRTTKITK